MLDLESKFAKAIVDLRMIRPFYSSLYETIEKIETDSINTIGVTSSKMYYNKDFLDNIEYEEMLFVILHEIAHIALKHPMRQGKRDHKYFNIAADIYINKALHEEFKLNEYGYSPDRKIKMPADAWFVSSTNTDTDCVESIYEELMNNRKDSTNGDFGYSGTNNSNDKKDDNNVNTSFKGSKIQGNVANHIIDDGLDNIEQENNLNRILSNALTKYDMTNADIGNNQGFLEREVREILKSTLDWQKLLRRYCIKSKQTDSSFIKPDKRMSYQRAIYPGQLNEEYNELEDVKVCIDTSGSINEEDIMYVLGQIKDITKQYKMSFEVLCWDTVIQKAYDATSIHNILNKGLAGGGGTRPSCVFNYLDKNKLKPGLVLVFTDGYLSTDDFSQRWNKKYKNTLWIMTRHYNKNFEQPFGKKAIAKFKD